MDKVTKERASLSRKSAFSSLKLAASMILTRCRFSLAVEIGRGKPPASDASLIVSGGTPLCSISGKMKGTNGFDVDGVEMHTFS